MYTRNQLIALNNNMPRLFGKKQWPTSVKRDYVLDVLNLALMRSEGENAKLFAPNELHMDFDKDIPAQIKELLKGVAGYQGMPDESMDALVVAAMYEGYQRRIHAGLPEVLTNTLRNEGIPETDVRRMSRKARNYQLRENKKSTAIPRGFTGDWALLSRLQKEFHDTFEKNSDYKKYKKLLYHRYDYMIADEDSRLTAERAGQVMEYLHEHALSYKPDYVDGKTEVLLPSLNGAAVTLFGGTDRRDPNGRMFTRVGDINDFATARRIDRDYMDNFYKLNKDHGNDIVRNSNEMASAQDPRYSGVAESLNEGRHSDVEPLRLLPENEAKYFPNPTTQLNSVLGLEKQDNFPTDNWTTGFDRNFKPINVAPKSMHIVMKNHLADDAPIVGYDKSHYKMPVAKRKDGTYVYKYTRLYTQKPPKSRRKNLDSEQNVNVQWAQKEKEEFEGRALALKERDGIDPATGMQSAQSVKNRYGIPRPVSYYADSNNAAVYKAIDSTGIGNFNIEGGSRLAVDENGKQVREYFFTNTITGEELPFDGSKLTEIMNSGDLTQRDEDGLVARYMKMLAIERKSLDAYLDTFNANQKDQTPENAQALADAEFRLKHAMLRGGDKTLNGYDLDDFVKLEGADFNKFLSERVLSKNSAGKIVSKLNPTRDADVLTYKGHPNFGVGDKRIDVKAKMIRINTFRSPLLNDGKKNKFNDHEVVHTAFEQDKAESATYHLGGLYEPNDLGVINIENNGEYSKTVVPGIEASFDKDMHPHFKTYPEALHETLCQSLSGQMASGVFAHDVDPETIDETTYEKMYESLDQFEEVEGNVDPSVIKDYYEIFKRRKLIHACDNLITTNGFYNQALNIDQLNPDEIKKRAKYLSRSVRLNKTEVEKMTDINAQPINDEKDSEKNEYDLMKEHKLSLLAFMMRHGDMRRLLPGWEKLVSPTETSVGKDQGLKLQLFSDVTVEDGRLVVSGDRVNGKKLVLDGKDFDIDILKNGGQVNGNVHYELAGRLKDIDEPTTQGLELLDHHDPADRQQMATNQYKHGNPLYKVKIAYMHMHGFTDNDALVITQKMAEKYPILKKDYEKEYKKLDAEKKNEGWTTEQVREYFKTEHARKRLEAQGLSDFQIEAALKKPNGILPEDDAFRPLSPGDKLSDNHGNKGVISLVIPDKEPERLEGMTDSKFKAIHDLWEVYQANPDMEIVATPVSPVSRHNVGSVKEIQANGGITRLNSPENSNIDLSGVTMGTISYYTCEDQSIEKKTSLGAERVTNGNEDDEANTDTSTKSSDDKKGRKLNYQQEITIMDCPETLRYMHEHGDQTDKKRFKDEMAFLGYGIDKDSVLRPMPPAPSDKQVLNGEITHDADVAKNYGTPYVKLKEPIKLKSGVMSQYLPVLDSYPGSKGIASYETIEDQKGQYYKLMDRIWEQDVASKDNIFLKAIEAKMPNSGNIVIQPDPFLDDAGDDWQYNGQSIPVIASIHDKEFYDKTVGRKNAMRLTVTNQKTGEKKVVTVGMISRPPALTKGNTAFGIIKYEPYPYTEAKSGGMSVSPQDVEQFQGDFDGDTMGVYSLNEDAEKNPELIKELISQTVMLRKPLTGEYFKETGLGMQASLARQGKELPDDLKTMTEFREQVHEAYDGAASVGDGLDLTDRDSFMNSCWHIIESGAKGKPEDMTGKFDEKTGEQLTVGIEEAYDSDKINYEAERDHMITSESKADAVGTAGYVPKQNAPFMANDVTKLYDKVKSQPIEYGDKTWTLPDKPSDTAMNAACNLHEPLYNGSMQAKHDAKQAQDVMQATKNLLRKAFTKADDTTETWQDMTKNILRACDGYNIPITQKVVEDAAIIAMAHCNADGKLDLENVRNRYMAIAMGQDQYIEQSLANGVDIDEMAQQTLVREKCFSGHGGSGSDSPKKHDVDDVKKYDTDDLPF